MEREGRERRGEGLARERREGWRERGKREEKDER